MKVVRKSRQKIYEEKTLEIFQNMPQTAILPLLPDYAQREWLYRLHADTRDKLFGITIQRPDALELLCQELRKCREEDEEESAEDEEMKEFWERLRRKNEVMYECRRKWKEQGKTEEECKRMWQIGTDAAVADWRAENGIALADWRAANGIAADFDAMQM